MIKASSQLALALTFFSLTACQQITGSSAKDIFKDDENAERRHKATNEELLWTIYLGGCTGSLVSPTHILTAAHCQPTTGAEYTSGATTAKGQVSADMQVTKIVEQNESLDYAILEFRWINGEEKTQKIPPLIATKPSDVVVSDKPNEGDEVFTVGFPTDKHDSWYATYSQGQLKEYTSPSLRYNIGTINGNSGGAVWRKKDFMLVTMTNNGAHPFGAPGWDQNDINNSNAWNGGSAMWDIYAVSTILKDIFPNGKNRFVTQNGLANDLHLALVADQGAQNSYVFILSSPDSVTKLIICENSSALDSCTETASGVIASSLKQKVGARKIYLADRKLVIPGQTASYSLIGIDSGGKRVSGSVINLQ